MIAPSRRIRWQGAALLAALPLLFFWRIVFADEVVYWGTPLLQFYPWRFLAVDALASGVWPLWNPWSDFGAPLAANLQTAAFSPLNLIYLALPVETAMGWTIVLHVALAGLLMYWCAGVWGLSPAASLFAALAFMFSGFVISRAGFLSMTAAAPWFPAVMGCVECAVVAAKARRNRMRWLALMAAATGLLLVAGHIQLAFYSLVAGCCFAVARAWTLSASDSSPDLKRADPPQHRFIPELARFGVMPRLLAPVVGGIMLGAALAAVQLLPTAELTTMSARRDGPGYDYAMNYSLYPFQAVQALAPDFFGNPAKSDYRGPGNYWEGTSYLGAATLLLALLGARWSRHPARWFLLGLTAAAWLFALGRHTPVFPWVFANVPGFGLFQAPARLLFWWTLAGPLLAGMGLDAAVALRGDRRLRPWITLTLASAGGIGVGVAAALVAVGASGMAGSSLAALLRGAALLAAAAALLLAAPRLGRWTAPALLTLLFADLAVFGYALNPTTSPALYRPPDAASALTQSAPTQRIYVKETDFERRFGGIFGFKSFGSNRAEDLAPLRQSLYPNLGAVAGVPDAFNYDPLRLERSRRLRGLVDRAADPAPLLRLMGVSHVYDASGNVRSAVPPLPRAFLIADVRRASGKDEAEQLMPTIDPARVAIVEAPLETLASLTTSTPSTAGGDLPAPDFRMERGAAVEVYTDAEAAALLVITESYYPGWTA
ncbi:MAG: hypothetical protein NTZ05_21895, partial [Chloroflexi bacterium]|nr:hypothetical protein [Chloroflexota bacterium]